jgi:hypothetical protein
MSALAFLATLARSPFALALMGAALVACSDGDAAGAGSPNPSTPQTAGTRTCVATPAVADLTSPTIAFETDVAPIFTQSCAFSACHASHTASNHGLFLDPKSAEDMAAVKAGLGAKSNALPTMAYVTPGDPENSFVMHKLDNDLCALDEHCTGGSCGDSMPDGNALLPVATRDVIRRWIAQGAK